MRLRQAPGLMPLPYHTYRGGSSWRHGGVAGSSAPPPLIPMGLQHLRGKILHVLHPVDAAPLAQGRGPLLTERSGTVIAYAIVRRLTATRAAQPDPAMEERVLWRRVVKCSLKYSDGFGYGSGSDHKHLPLTGTKPVRASCF